MSEQPIANTSDDIKTSQTAGEVSMGKDKNTLGPADGEGSKKSRGLLNVPSRSSSHKNQSSPTSTGLSGATANDSRNSIGGRSRDSKGSLLGRQRNGSASSKRTGGDSDPTHTVENSQPGSPVQRRKKKKNGGILSFLGCCGGSADSDDATDADTENVHKLQRLPQRTNTSQSRTHPVHDQSASKPVNEKDAAGAAQSSEPQQSSEVPDRISPPNGESSGAYAGPSVTVEPPQARAREGEAGQDHNPAAGTEAAMPDPGAEAQNGADTIIASETEDPSSTAPGPGPMQTVPITPAETDAAGAEPQKALLPEILPEHKGRKCLVLDLDETLVHSSFKILHQADFTIPVEIEGNYHNVYVIKRPGVDEFMKRVGELYEVVVFTASVSKYGDPLLDQLDIHKVVHHRLFRESCYNHQGNYVKDLSQIGRDLKDTIIIDNSPTSYIFHPQHAVPISSWFSDAHDNELLDLIPVLEDLAGPTVADVSLVLDVTL